MPLTTRSTVNIDFMKTKEPLNSVIGGIFDTKSGRKLLGIIKITLFTIIAAAIIIVSLANLITMPYIVIGIASMIVTASTLLYLIEYGKRAWDTKKQEYEKEFPNDDPQKETQDKSTNTVETEDKSTNTVETEDTSMNTTEAYGILSNTDNEKQR